MINPSIEGLLKIGKTTRDPDSRAKELSQATGVATPFNVAFSIEVPDCRAAEEYVYAILEHNGFKRSPNREFFQMPLRHAIEVLVLAQKELQRQQRMPLTERLQSEGIDEAEFDSEHPGVAVFEKAVDVYYGIGDEIEDKREALNLFNRAKALNFGPAYTAMAEYLIQQAEDARFEEDTQEMSALYEKAFDVLKEGALKGHGRCYVKMAELYEIQNNSTNAIKCWKKYFQSPAFINDLDQNGDIIAALETMKAGDRG